MKYAFIDCGSSTTRWYCIEEHEVKGIFIDPKGINSVSGKEELKVQLLSQLEAFRTQMNLKEGEILCYIAAGMITSNLGLVEVPHQVAPVGLQGFWDTMKVLDGEESPFDAPMYLVRGVKNAGVPEVFSELVNSDLMRGEELQTLGVLESYPVTDKPACIIELGSTTKLILVNEKQEILASYTSLSGQTYQAISEGTFIGNSIKKRGEKERPEGYFDPQIVEEAMKCEDEVGFLRSVMLVRFGDVLMNYEWYERELFFSSLFAAADRKWLSRQLSIFEGKRPQIYLVGQKRRCQIYEAVLEKLIQADFHKITDAEEVNQLAVRGAILLAKMFIHA